jgi:hypothetical protein
MPGVLGVGDLNRIAEVLGYADIEAFAQDHLVVVDGLKVAIQPPGQKTKRLVSIPTLAPAARADGSCHWLEGGRCSIHAVSPFGCAYIDAHMSNSDTERRSVFLYRELLADLEADGQYTRLCAGLRRKGHIGLAVDLQRYRLVKAMKREFGK